MFMRDDRIMQNFCWMPEAKWRFTIKIKIMMDVYQTFLAKPAQTIMYFG